jgi:hypothetical protein
VCFGVRELTKADNAPGMLSSPVSWSGFCVSIGAARATELVVSGEAGRRAAIPTETSNTAGGHRRCRWNSEETSECPLDAWFGRSPGDPFEDDDCAEDAEVRAEFPQAGQRHVVDRRPRPRHRPPEQIANRVGREILPNLLVHLQLDVVHGSEGGSRECRRGQSVSAERGSRQRPGYRDHEQVEPDVVDEESDAGDDRKVFGCRRAEKPGDRCPLGCHRS